MVTNLAVEPVSIFCVDDNPHVIQAVQLQLGGEEEFEWHGSAMDADSLLEEVRNNCPDIVLLDIDMPGKNAFEAIEELRSVCRKARVVMFSALIERDLLEKAIDAGAWGYVAKSDGAGALVEAIRRVVSGSLGFSPSIASLH